RQRLSAMRTRYRTLAADKRLAPREAAIGKRLPYGQHVDEATIRTRDGLLIQVVKLDGFPFETMDDEELGYRKAVREPLLRGATRRALDLDAELRQLHAMRETFVAALAPYGARTLTTYEGEHGLCSEPASFLAALLGGAPRPILLPEGDIGELIADRRL